MNTVLIKKMVIAALTSTALLAVLPMSASAVTKADAAAAESQSSNTMETIAKKMWIYKNGNWYFKLDDVYVKGWLRSENNWYYFDSQGVMVNNTIIKIDGKVYTFDSEGICTDTLQYIRQLSADVEHSLIMRRFKLKTKFTNVNQSQEIVKDEGININSAQEGTAENLRQFPPMLY